MIEVDLEPMNAPAFPAPPPPRPAVATTTTTATNREVTNKGATHQSAAPSENGPRRHEEQIQLSEFVGEHGVYQLALTVLLFFRYILLGLMANSGPLLTPDVTFYCQLPLQEIEAIMPNITQLDADQQNLEIREEFKQICQIDVHLYQKAYYWNSSSSSNPSLLASNQTVGLRHHQLRPIKFNSSDLLRECSDFTYDLAPDQGRTITSEFDLVCDREWLRSIFQSILSASIVISHTLCGTFSDKYGRQRAQRVAYVVSLLAGVLSVFAPDFWTLMVARALCSFGDLGQVVSLTTTLVELVGNRYRGMSVALVNFGFALGVSILPYIVAYFEDFRTIIVFTVACHLATAPLIFATGESVRWLMTNRQFKSARKELEHIFRLNERLCPRAFTYAPSVPPTSGAPFEARFKELMAQFCIDPMLERDPLSPPVSTAPKPAPDCSRLESPRPGRFAEAGSLAASVSSTQTVASPMKAADLQQAGPIKRLELEDALLNRMKHHHSGGNNQHLDCIDLVASQISFVGRVNWLFRDKMLMLVVFTIVWTTFNSELLYTSFIIINLEVGEDLYLNYMLGGCMEALAAISASLLLSYAPRRGSLIAFWLLISLSCAGLSIAHIDSTWAVWLLAVAKFLQSSLSTIASVAAYESFPTFLRQSGSGLVFTLGMLGSVFAPLIFAEFDDHAGMDRVLMTFSVLSLTAALLIYKYLKETRGCELR